jgi:hypothetical protein
MNKLTTTAGFLALSAASLQAAVNAPPAGSQGAAKPWSVSATLRGFYDDNYNTGTKGAPPITVITPSGPKTVTPGAPKESFGIEVSPSIGLNWVQETTTLGFNYAYSMRWFEARPNNDIDHMHQVNGKLSHAFTERYKVDLSDSFVVAQEPQILDPTLTTLPIRAEGDNKRNTANASFSAGVGPNTDIVLGYQNNWYDYDEPFFYSPLLDRMEHLPSINLRQVVLPKTVAVVGYQFGSTEYQSKNPIIASYGSISGVPGLPSGVPVTALTPASYRDNYSHYIYAGVDQQITSTLNASVRVGAQYTDYHETGSKRVLYVPVAPFAPVVGPATDRNEWSPYADANATWTYMEGSYVQLGVRHQRTPTDIAFLPSTTNGDLTLDAEATSVYGSLNHKLTPKIVGSLLGQYQHMDYKGGGANNRGDDIATLGINFAYQFNQFLAAEVGYNYDRIWSGLQDLGYPRTYERNRVYAGIRATY